MAEIVATLPVVSDDNSPKSPVESTVKTSVPPDCKANIFPNESLRFTVKVVPGIVAGKVAVNPADGDVEPDNVV